MKNKHAQALALYRWHPDTVVRHNGRIMGNLTEPKRKKNTKRAPRRRAQNPRASWWYRPHEIWELLLGVLGFAFALGLTVWMFAALQAIIE